MRTLKIAIATAIVATLLVVAGLVSAAGTEEEQFDAAATYKTKCVACHGKQAEKKFNTELKDEEMIDIVLKGKKPEKPPNMPAYGEKGVTAEQAKTLVDYMKQLKTAPAP